MNLVFQKNGKTLSEIVTNGALLVMAVLYLLSVISDKPQWAISGVTGYACILFLFFMGLWRLGNQLFEKKDEVIAFVLIAVGLYGMLAFRSGQSAVNGIFTNSWNGLTLLSCFVMPVAFCICLGWMNETEVCNRVTGVVGKVFSSAVLLLAGQFTDEKGGFYIALMLLVTVAVIIVRKGYDYVITSGRFKKRI